MDTLDLLDLALPPPGANGRHFKGVAHAPPGDDVPADQGQASEPRDPDVRLFTNFVDVKAGKGKNAKPVRVGKPIAHIRDNLLSLTGGWPKRVGPLLFVPGADGRPLYLETEPERFAWIAGRLGGHLNPVRWARGANMVGQGQFSAYLGQTVAAFEAVEEFPHWPLLAGHYYMHPDLKPAGGTALRELVARFRPATPLDHDLILSFFLTLAWGGLPGRRPAYLFTSAEEEDVDRGRGAGKTTVAKVGGWLFGGMIQAGLNDDIDKLKTRLLTPSALGTRIVLLDNLKSLKLSCGELEGLITSGTVSGHRMYYGEAHRPNTLTFCLTINGASLSKDLAQRVIPVKLERPVYSGQWEEETHAMVESKRWEIIADLVDVLRGSAAALTKFSRWGSWEQDVLARVAEPAECQAVIAERQAAYDEDAADADLVADRFRLELGHRGHDADAACIWIPAAVAAEWVNSATNENRPTNKAGSYLGTLAIAELRRSNRTDGRGWCWRGKQAPPGAPAAQLGRFG